MVLLLTQDDLRPLIESDEQLLRAFERLEKAILHQKHDPPDRSVGVDVPLEANGLHHLRLTPLPDAATLCWFPKSGDEAFAANANFLMLLDPASGSLRALCCGDDLSILCTALPAAVGVRRLASPGARVLAILGHGQEARGHLHAYRPALPDLDEVQVFSTSSTDGRRFAEEASHRYGITVTVADSSRAAIENADVVAILEAGDHIRFEMEWLKPGATVVQVDPGGVPSGLASAARLVVPVHPEWSQGNGGESDSFPSVDLADVIAGLVHAREHQTQIVWWDVTAPRPWDPPVANWVYRWATEQGAGTEFSLTSEQRPRAIE